MIINFLLLFRQEFFYLLRNKKMTLFFWEYSMFVNYL